MAWPDDDLRETRTPTPGQSRDIPPILRYRRVTAFVFAAMCLGLHALAAGACYERAAQLGWRRWQLVLALIVSALLAPAVAGLTASRVRQWQLSGFESVGAVCFASGFVALVVLIVVAGAVPS